MPRKPAYFDSQASAAATLKIDISELREAKSEGCPAFRSGRVYTAPLLAWFAEKRRRSREVGNTKTDNGVADHALVGGSQKNQELSKAYWDRKKAAARLRARSLPLRRDGALFRLVSEAQRIRLAHLFDPVLAVHTSLVDPLPHQITAVYEQCCRGSRFVLTN